MRPPAVLACLLLAWPLPGQSGDRLQGDWTGALVAGQGEPQPFVARVLALGERWYELHLHAAFDTRAAPLIVLDGFSDADKALFVGRATTGPMAGTKLRLTLEGGELRGDLLGGPSGRISLTRVVRRPPSLGAPPPLGAVVLFDGKGLAAWRTARGDGEVAWRVVEHALEVVPRTGSIVSKQGFGDCQLHLEFQTPLMPAARGQGRGNSGVYLQSRYELQVLDSYALEGRANECGGIYGIAAPRVNMCAPPGTWQTYDVAFRAARFDRDGKKTENARLTVRHNGVEIHRDVEVPRPTTAAPLGEGPEPGGLYLQDHGNRVRYRNIWILEPDGG